MTVRIITGDCRDVLATLPDESVHCVVSSPPYFGLRDYGSPGQLGLEEIYTDYVDKMVGVFEAVRRVLRKDGTVWINLGDSYSSGGRDSYGTWAPDSKQATHTAIKSANRSPEQVGIKPKDLIGIPWRVAFALQADGWYLRQDIIWSKPNPMPESVRDRCTKAHEYLFLLSKSERYYFDQEAIMEPVTASTIERLSQPTLDQQEGSWRVPGKTNGPMKAKLPRGKALTSPRHDGNAWNENNGRGFFPNEQMTRNKRSVWEVTTQPFSEAHFATFPPALIEPCILAGCPKECCAECGAPLMRETERTEILLRPNSDSIRGNSASHTRALGSSPQRGGVACDVRTLGWARSCSCNADTVPGTVLDPFGGAGTTGLVADRLQRNAILIELNPEYAEMARRRIHNDAPLFVEAAE